MREDYLKKKLEKEFKKVYVWTDKPNEIYEKHSHPYEFKLIILEGSMKLKAEEESFVLKKGSEINIGKNKEHEAVVGKEGCRYLVGEKIK